MSFGFGVADLEAPSLGGLRCGVVAAFVGVDGSCVLREPAAGDGAILEDLGVL